MKLSAKRPINLNGVARHAADAVAGVDVLARLLVSRRGMSLRDLRETLRRSSVLADALTENKRVLFGRRIFTDVYSPPWPDRSFHEMVEALTTDTPFAGLVVFAITSKCMFRCEHCYAAKALKKREVLSPEIVLSTVDQICKQGAGLLSLEGGEPMLRFDLLLEALRVIDGRATPFIATTGWALNERKAAALAEAGLAAAQISLDHYIPERHNTFRRNDKAFATAARAVKLYRDAGVLPVLVVCATRDVISGGGLFKYLELAKELGAGMTQLIDPLPSGNYLTAAADTSLRPHEMDALLDFQRVANTEPKYRDYPAVTARAHIEHESRFGCGMGGNATYYVDSSGNVQPCVFTQMAVGNVNDEELSVILQRMRGMFTKVIGGPCPVHEVSKPIAAAIEGGASNPVGCATTEVLAAKLMERDEPEVTRKLSRQLPIVRGH